MVVSFVPNWRAALILSYGLKIPRALAICISTQVSLWCFFFGPEAMTFIYVYSHITDSNCDANFPDDFGQKDTPDLDITGQCSSVMYKQYRSFDIRC